jgi:hypothetical protein
MRQITRCKFVRPASAGRNIRFRPAYFFAVFLPASFFAAARRSVFLRRAARFLTLSLPWLFPIRLQLPPFSAITK